MGVMDLCMSCLAGTPKSWKGSKRGREKLSMYSSAPPNQKVGFRVKALGFRVWGCGVLGPGASLRQGPGHGQPQEHERDQKRDTNINTHANTNTNTGTYTITCAYTCTQARTHTSTSTSTYAKHTCTCVSRYKQNYA